MLAAVAAEASGAPCAASYLSRVIAGATAMRIGRHAEPTAEEQGGDAGCRLSRAPSERVAVPPTS